MGTNRLIHLTRQVPASPVKVLLNIGWFCFPKKTRAAVLALYSWCQSCKDRMDQVQSPADAHRVWDELQQLTRSAQNTKTQMADPNFEGLRLVLQTTQLPLEFPLSFLRGLLTEAQFPAPRNQAELLEYCSQTAGAIGLMVCHLIGVQDRAALEHAVELSQGLRLTQISRDIEKDLRQNRVFVPLDWLESNGLSPQNLHEGWARYLWPRLSHQLLTLAEQKLESGRQIFHFLSFRGSWAVNVTLGLWRHLGRKILDQGARAWDKPCAFSYFEVALVILIESALTMLLHLPRLLTRRRRQMRLG